MYITDNTLPCQQLASNIVATVSQTLSSNLPVGGAGDSTEVHNYWTKSKLV